MNKDTMSQELTELLQEKAQPVKEKSERLIFRWQEEDEASEGEKKHE